MMNFASLQWSGTGGSSHGGTYVRKNGGYYGRKKNRPKKSNSNSQQFQRTSFSYATRSWLTVLTGGERTDWQTFADSFTYVTGLPPYYKISGLNHYVRQSQFMTNFGGPGNIGGTIGPGTIQQGLNITTAQIELDNPLPGTTDLVIEGSATQDTGSNCLVGVYLWTRGNSNVKKNPSKLPILTMFFIPAGPAGTTFSQRFFVPQIADLYSPGWQVPLTMVIWDNANMSDWYRILMPVIQF